MVMGSLLLTACVKSSPPARVESYGADDSGVRIAEIESTRGLYRVVDERNSVVCYYARANFGATGREAPALSCVQVHGATP